MRIQGQALCACGDVAGEFPSAHNVLMTRKASPKSPKARNFIREHRKVAGLTLEQLAERIGMTHQNLGKIERGLVPASDQLLEKLAIELRTDIGSLTMRDPTKKDALWSIWEVAQTLSPQEQEVAAKMLAGLKGTGTSG